MFNWFNDTRMLVKILGLVFLVMLLLAVSLTIFNYFNLTEVMTVMKGEQLLQYGGEVLLRVGETINGSVAALEALALSPSIVQKVVSTNSIYAQRDQAELRAEIQDLDEAWRDNETTANSLVNRIAANSVSAEILLFQEKFPEQVEIFVTGVHGFNVAMTERTSDYLQSDEEWWQSAYDDGRGAVYVGDVEYDESAHSWAMNVGVPIIDPQGGAVVGVLRGTIDVSQVFDTLEEITLGDTGHVTLLDKTGRILFGHEHEYEYVAEMQSIDGPILSLIEGGKDVWRKDIADLEGVPSILAMRFMPGELADSLQWSLLLSQHKSEVNAKLFACLGNSIFVAFITVLIGLVAAIVVSQSIVKPLLRLQDCANQIAEGNLQIVVDVEQDDEIGQVAKAFNLMVINLREILGRVQETSDNLKAAAAEILAATTQQASGANEQSAAIAQTTTTVDEVRVISEQAIVRGKEVSDSSQRTVDISTSGRSAVEETINSMAEIRERVEGIAENILALSEQTWQIGEITSTVNDIASQSNMLALNASVEAARAGEHGKGFAVVAVEVRNLAEQSKQATSQVRAILTDIQNAINASVMVTEEGAKSVDKGVTRAAQARAAIEQLSSMVSESARIASQVAAGGQQQASGVEQIALAMQNINQAMVQSLASTRQAERSAQSLNVLARSLNETVLQYKFADSHGNGNGGRGAHLS